MLTQTPERDSRLHTTLWRELPGHLPLLGGLLAATADQSAVVQP
jgi:hypothetical protein